jgi:hypothetical protein
MELNAIEVLKVLKKKEVKNFHHANTVQTACVFLQNARLLSRGTVDEKGVQQTAQKSDALDKRFGIWYDVFLDAVDIHARAKTRNLYGPVLFVLALEILEEDWLSSVWITKKNPTQWKAGDRPEDRYFQSVSEFDADYKYGNFASMFILRSVGGVLRLSPHLKSIVVDDPNWDDGSDVYAQTIGALRASAWQGGLKDLVITRRECVPACSCKGQYAKVKNDSKNENKSSLDVLRQYFFLDSDPE